MTPLYPYHSPSKSLADRLHTAEFDDALVDQIAWKNLRYNGCKVKSKEINKFTSQQTASAAQTGIGFANIISIGPTIGEMVIGGTGQTIFTVGGYYTSNNEQPPLSGLPGSFQVEVFSPKVTYEGDTINPIGLSPNIKNETTALYIASTVIGGEEDPQFADIKNHSYVSIDRILLINPRTDETKIIEKQSTDFAPFHTFITNDLPTGGSFSVRLIEEFIQNNLKGPDQYKVKMNKGWLLKTFDFQFAESLPQLTENNSIYLYKGGTVTDNFYTEGSGDSGSSTPYDNNDRIRFRYGMIEMIQGSFNPITGIYGGHHLQRENIGPSFGSSSIIENKFTQQYYSGSYGFINEPPQPQGIFNADLIASTGLGSASRFIGLDSLNFLRNNNIDTTLTEQEKTELHITFLQGTKDFSSGSNDERSIGTFEIDRNQEQLDVGGVCHDFLPKNHEILLKSINDDRFIPKISTFEDTFISAYATSSFTVDNACIQINQFAPQEATTKIQLGINADQTQDADIYIQGGALGDVGFVSYQSASAATYGQSLSSSMAAPDNFYSGSLNYQLSWLDKDHTIITNLDKNAELFDGIGSKGIVIIPEHIHPKIKNNINFYLQQAGIGSGNAPNSPTLLDDDFGLTT